jgi:polyphosphate glucokinase
MATNLKPYTLAIDIGGTGLKMIVLDRKGRPVTKRSKVITPRPAKPSAIVDALMSMIVDQGNFDRISVGFPGVVLHESWHNYNLQRALEKLTGKPTIVANDADVQGFGDIKGKGVEMVITLGTGMGSAIFVDGHLVPNLELGHHPFKKSYTYEDLLGKDGLKKGGKKKWNKHVIEAIDLMARIFNFDHLYLGGGNAELITASLPQNVHLSSNLAGLLGGIKLWELHPPK